MTTMKKQPAAGKFIRKIKGAHVVSQLGISTNNTMEIVHQIRKGLPARSLKIFQEATGLTVTEIADFAAISKRTLQRRQGTGKLLADESDRLLRASRIFDMAVDLFEGDKSAALKWLQSPQPGLGGETPLRFASTEVGAREVENLIGRLEHGVFS